MKEFEYDINISKHDSKVDVRSSPWPHQLYPYASADVYV